MRAIGLVLAEGGLRAYFGLCREGMITNRIVARLQTSMKSGSALC